MELSPPGLYGLEELVAPRRENWSTVFSTDTFFPNGWIASSFESLDQNPDFVSSNNSSLLDLLTIPQESTTFACPDLQASHQHQPHPILPTDHTFTSTAQFPPQDIDEYAATLVEAHHDNNGVFGQLNLDKDHFSGFEDASLRSRSCTKVKMEQGINNVGLMPGEKRSKSKKVEGQPSKNLMAERRRRKRLNDRLSMLRSIVPKISKMDRTSILGDTIDYMKELLDKIQKLREDNMEEDDKNHMKYSTPNTRELKTNEAIVRNPPKFDVERRSVDTRIEICCATKPGLLLSTVSTLEALGLDIHQCVISCFNDFSFQASCSEATEHRTGLSPEDVKQALFKTAGYGGRCL